VAVYYNKTQHTNNTHHTPHSKKHSTQNYTNNKGHTTHNETTLYCLVDDINIWEEPPASQSSNLKTAEADPSQTLVPICDNTQHHNPEDHNPNIPAEKTSDLSYWREEPLGRPRHRRNDNMKVILNK
jgi:hypothetical protein